MRITVVCLVALLAAAACGVQEPEVEATTSELESMDWSYWDQGALDDPRWKTEYPDAWPAGRGPLGYGESYLATTVGYGPDPAHKHITTYFRNRTFIIQQQQEIERVYADVMYDDGFVLYIQGQRVYSVGLPATDPVSPTQLASGHEAGNRYERIDLTPFRHLFDRGYVDFAVEVHQSEPSSSDLVFDMRFELELTPQEEGVAIAREATWTYWDGYTDRTGWRDRFYYPTDWRTGAAPIGYGESYIATPIRQPTQAGQAPTTLYRRVFDLPDGVTGSITELTGELMYDDGVVVWLNGTRIDSLAMPPGDATFQTLSTGHEAGQRYVTRDWSQFAGLLVEYHNVLAVELHQHDRTSSDAVFDVALRYRTSPPPPVPTEDIPRGAVWTYWDRGGDLGTAWRAPSHDDSSWRRGAAPLGYGESYVATTVEYGPDAGHKHRTTYFRNRFRVADTDAVTGLVADVMYDDGVVVYLNGTEVKRLFMPSGTITASTLASGHETGNNYERYDLSAARSLLVDGDNVITVEVHQASDSSSDLTFDLALDVSTGGPPPPPPAPGIARGSSWRYFASAVAPPWSWASPSFDDARWPLLPGPLGYGESYLRSTVPYGPDPANKYITTYFRGAFVVEDPAQVSSMFLELMYDDGAVVYLNGNRILSVQLPDDVGHETFARWHEASNTYERFDIAHAIQHLKPGRNTIAVEVHQESRASSDLVFDLALGFDAGTVTGSTPRHSSWLYYDRGPLANGWQDSTDNTGWDAAQATIGYNDRYVAFRGQIGENGQRQPLTTYFRRTFRVDPAASIQQLRGELLVDDGAVVYLNGVEIARPWMPSGPVGFDTRATSREAGSYIIFDFSSRIPLLRPGVNVLAVEVHQDAAHAPGNPDNDLVFDLAFEIITSDTPRLPGCTSPMTPPGDATLTDVWIAPGGAAWATGTSGMVGRRQSNGWAWCSTGGDPTVGFNAVWGAADDDVWFAGTGGILLRWDGRGLERVDPDTGSGDELRAMWGSSASDVFVVGDQGRVHHWNGVTWQAVTVPRGGVSAVWGASAADVWAVGRDYVPSSTGDDYDDECHSTIFRWNPAARSFDLERDFVITHGGCGFEGVSGTDAGNVWAVGDQFPAGAAASYAFTAHFDGATWTGIHPNEEQAVDRTYTDVAVGAPGAENGAWMVAQGRGIVRWDGVEWTSGPEPLTDDLYAIDARGSVMFAVGRDARIVRWNGVTWVADE